MKRIGIVKCDLFNFNETVFSCQLMTDEELKESIVLAIKKGTKVEWHRDFKEWLVSEDYANCFATSIDKEYVKEIKRIKVKDIKDTAKVIKQFQSLAVTLGAGLGHRYAQAKRTKWWSATNPEAWQEAALILGLDVEVRKHASWHGGYFDVFLNGYTMKGSKTRA